MNALPLREQAIAQNWSLSEIKQYISENKTPNPQKTEAKIPFSVDR